MDRYLQQGPPLFLKEDGSLGEYICSRAPEQDRVFVRMRLHCSKEKAEEYREITMRLQRLNEVQGVRKVYECVLEEPGGLRTFLVEEGEYISLSEWLRVNQKVLNKDEFWQLHQTLQDTLVAVHSRFVAHGGLTPSAVYLSHSTCVIGDFADIKWRWQCGSEKPISGYSCPEIKAGREPVDWYQADRYSAGLVLLFALTGQPPDSISLDPQLAAQEVYQCIASAQHPITISVAICSLMSLPEPYGDLYVCSYCAEETGVVTADGTYKCLNQKCELNKEQGGKMVAQKIPQFAPSFQAISMQPVNEARPIKPLCLEMKNEGVHPQQVKTDSEMQVVQDSSVDSSPTLQKVCIICQKNFPFKPSHWIRVIQSLPKTFISDICSLHCFEKYCRAFGFTNDTRNRCMECFSGIPQQMNTVKRLACSTEHWFCSEKCWVRYRHRNFCCPRCGQLLNLVQVEGNGCSRSGGREGVKVLKCEHGNCTECLPMMGNVGPVRCMKAECRDFKVDSQ